MVVDSSGNLAFEKAAVKALNQMTFAPARRGDTPIDSSYMVKMKFAIDDLAKGADPHFVAVYRRFVNAIEAADKEKADAQLADLKPQNLYEEAFANYSKHFYHKKWGTPAEELTDLRRAIAGETRPGYLPKDTFTAAHVAMFVLEVKAYDYGGALGTWETLEPLAPKAQRPNLQRAVDEIHAIEASDQTVRMSGTIDQSSLWNGKLFRNRFSIEVKSGAVSEIKLRCEKQYLFFKYTPGVEYSIGSQKDRCSIEVVGDPGTMFDFFQ
jgi:hypothetical protein